MLHCPLENISSHTVWYLQLFHYSYILMSTWQIKEPYDIFIVKVFRLFTTHSSITLGIFNIENCIAVRTMKKGRKTQLWSNSHLIWNISLLQLYLKDPWKIQKLWSTDFVYCHQKWNCVLRGRRLVCCFLEL